VAASAHLLLSALSKRDTTLFAHEPEQSAHGTEQPAHEWEQSAHEAEPSAEPQLCAFTAEGACAEAPLTSEPPLPDAEPLTSEPPLADAAPLTSESDFGTADAAGPDHTGY